MSILGVVVPPSPLKKKKKGERDSVHIQYKERETHTHSEETHFTSRAQSFLLNKNKMLSNQIF